MRDTYRELWNRVLLRCPSVSPFLAQDWVRNAFRQIAERRRWSWLLKRGQFLVPPVVSQGQAQVTRGSTRVFGVGTSWTPELVGRQFRSAISVPIYTITQVINQTTLELDAPWGGPADSVLGYRIYQVYYTPPDDFHAFVSVWDPAMGRQLGLHVQSRELDLRDAMRTNSGQAHFVVQADYTRERNGTVGPVIRGFGTSGTDPVSAGIFTGPVDATFAIECTVSGAAGVAQFAWRKDNSASVAAPTVADTPQELQDGVLVVWPSNQGQYAAGTVWVIQTYAADAPGLPRYELWPHMFGPYVYPFLYESVAPDLSDLGAVVPRYIRGDVLLDMALAQAARWPGPSTDKPNPYYNLRLADSHDLRAERMIVEMELSDDETYEQDLIYNYPETSWPQSGWDAQFLQSHAI